jgi:maltose alpha-D-glucosyltransferase/alpha-amylase
MVFHFPVMPRLFLAIESGDVTPIVDVLMDTPTIPDGTQWAMFLRNHDELTLEMVTEADRESLNRAYAPDPQMRKNIGIRRRLSPLLGSDRRKIELLNAVLMSLPGTPIIYYGDEIGMGDNTDLDDRDGLRTPMQWDATNSAGWSAADPDEFYLPVITSSDYGTRSVNVQDARRDSRSLLNWMRDLISTRPPEMGTAPYGQVETNDTGILGFHRGSTTVYANFTDEPKTIEDTGRSLLAGNAALDDTEITLPPYGWAWLR